MERIWDRYITHHDRQVYAKAGLGKPLRFGTRPAVLVIDVQYRTTGEKPEPILSAMDTYLTACGEPAWQVVGVIRALLAEARTQKVPVFYPIVLRQDSFDAQPRREKILSLVGVEQQVGHRGAEIVAEVAPEKGDVILGKKYASAFFGTPLMSHLNDLDVDTVIVTGCTTSGCVRATVIDAFSYGFRVCVVEDGVYDRGEVTHAINLWDMAMKYAEVLPGARVIDYFRSLPDRAE